MTNIRYVHVPYMTISTTSNQRFPTSIFIFPLGLLQIGKYEECKDRIMLSTLYDAGRGQQLFLPPHPPPESFTTPKMWNNDNYLLSFFMSFCLKMSMNKTQRQLCKRLAGPFIPFSWSCLVWKRVLLWI